MTAQATDTCHHIIAASGDYIHETMGVRRTMMLGSKRIEVIPGFCMRISAEMAIQLLACIQDIVPEFVNKRAYVVSEELEEHVCWAVARHDSSFFLVKAIFLEE